jgi:hypothetical protein
MMSIAGAALRRTERSTRVLLLDSQYGEVSQVATIMGLSLVLIVRMYYTQDVVCPLDKMILPLNIDLPSELIEAPLSRNSLSPI